MLAFGLRHGLDRFVYACEIGTLCLLSLVIHHDADVDTVEADETSGHDVVDVAQNAKANDDRQANYVENEVAHEGAALELGRSRKLTLMKPPKYMIRPKMSVVMIKPAPKMLPMAIRVPYSSLCATTEARKSGAPLANAIRVILHKVKGCTPREFRRVPSRSPRKPWQGIGISQQF